MHIRKSCMLLCASVIAVLAVVHSASAQTPLPAPSFGPGGGTYTYNLQVAISRAYPWESIIYTTDGSTPSPTHGTQYEGAIPVTTSVTIKAMAAALNGNGNGTYSNSPVATASYVLNVPSEAPLPQGEWAWESGGTTGGGCPYTPGAMGTYGTLGVPAAGNLPGSRSPAAHWTDKNGNFWLFGGVTPTASGQCAYSNDIWMFDISTKEWAWMGGSKTYAGEFQAGVYGTRGRFAAGNVPGGRENCVFWTDRDGNFWLFGGDGADSTGGYGLLNDMWEYNPTTRQWAWMAGSNVANVFGSYGTFRSAAPGNTPGARFNAVGWTDLNNNLWLFGGYSYIPSGMQGEINDLWEFNTSTHEWAWMGGSNGIGQYGNYGTHLIPSAANIPGARYNAVGWVDALGKFWLFGGVGNGAPGYGGLLNDLWEFNPSNLNWTWASGSADCGTYISPAQSGQGGLYDQMTIPERGNTPGSRVGATTWTDAQGNLWMFGGVGYDSAGGYGSLNDLWEFDRAKWLWAWMGGSETVPPASSATVYGPYRVASPQTQPGARSGSVGWTDKYGNLWMFGGFGGGMNYGYLNDLFEYQLP